MLLIKYLQFKSKFTWALSNLIAFLRWNLFTYRDLWKWIDNPFEILPIKPQPVQYVLSLPGLGRSWTAVSLAVKLKSKIMHEFFGHVDEVFNVDELVGRMSAYIAGSDKAKAGDFHFFRL